MPYQHIAYVSTATRFLTPEEIDALLLDAREYNQQVQVTGVLLCHKTTFFQFFEGLPKDVADVYERIKSSHRHTNIFELVNEPSESRYFEEWAMGFCYVPKTEIQLLANAKWQSQIPLLEKHAKKSFAIKMLQEFWLKMSVDQRLKLGV